MPFKTFSHYCPAECGRRHQGVSRKCPKCGGKAEFHKWMWGWSERQANHYHRTGLEIHAPLPPQWQDRQLCRLCRPCNGTGLKKPFSESEGGPCPSCSGAGGFPMLTGVEYAEAARHGRRVRARIAAEYAAYREEADREWESVIRSAPRRRVGEP